MNKFAVTIAFGLVYKRPSILRYLNVSADDTAGINALLTYWQGNMKRVRLPLP